MNIWNLPEIAAFYSLLFIYYGVIIFIFCDCHKTAVGPFVGGIRRGLFIQFNWKQNNKKSPRTEGAAIQKPELKKLTAIYLP